VCKAGEEALYDKKILKFLLSPHPNEEEKQAGKQAGKQASVGHIRKQVRYAFQSLYF